MMGNIFNEPNIVDLNSLIQSMGKIAGVILSLLAFVYTVIKIFLKYVNQSKYLIEELHPNFSAFEIRNATKYFIPTYGTTQIPIYQDEPYKQEFIKN